MCAYFAGHKDLNLLNPESIKVFRELIENIKMGIFMADFYGNIFYVNHTFNEQLGFPNHTHVTGKNWTKLFFPDQAQESAFLTKFNTSGFVSDFETVYVNKQGFKKVLSITANLIHAENGDIIGVRGAIADISERCTFQEQLRLKNNKLEEIIDFYNQLSDFTLANKINEFIVQQTAQILEAQRCSIMTLDVSKNQLILNASCGIPEEFLNEADVKIGEPIAGMVALSSQAVLVDNIEYHELFKRQKRKSYKQRSFMSAPLMYNHKLVGIINVTEKEGGFTASHLKILETIAKHAAINICKTEELSNFEYLSQTDPMTGLLNFRCFTNKIEGELPRVERYGEGLSLMMIDVDNFKKYNDTHGHLGGDQLLKQLAEIFKKNLRATEYICRYGGDEFAIIMPNTNGMQAGVVAEKLRKKVVQDFIDDGVSLSIGIAQYQLKDTKEMLIKKADEALYQAKKNGRNKVFIANITIM